MFATKTISKALIALIAFTIFLGALLLFQIQPIMGRFILPWFGSTAGVWAVTLMFFQVVLLFGYTYSHFLSTRFTWSAQAKIHLALLALSILILPITPDEALKPDNSNDPSAQVLLILSLSVGIPYALLAATAPLLQRWFSVLYPNRATYRLYALSNGGSLIGLISYPLIIEPLASTTTQTLLWSSSYFTFIVACGFIALAVLKSSSELYSHQSKSLESHKEMAALTKSDLAFWCSLSALASGLLLAITNRITIDVAVTPFLWVLPLTLYLLSFIVTFDSDRWYKRAVFLPMLPVIIFLAARLALFSMGMSYQIQLLGYCTVLFYTCICCHGEIAKSRPDPKHLTAFFLCISVGGAAGGAFTAVLAPLVFSSFVEMPIFLMAAYLIIFGKLLKTNLSSDFLKNFTPNIKTLSLLAAIITLVISGFSVPLLFTLINDLNARIAGVFLVCSFVLPVTLAFLAYYMAGPAKPFTSWCQEFEGQFTLATYSASTMLFLALSGAFLLAGLGEQKNNLKADRNFYGHTAIKTKAFGDYGEAKLLMHGRILHGQQFNEYPTWPVGYYHPSGGISLAITNHPNNISGESLKVGVIGLGTGTIAAFANNTIRLGEDSKSFITSPSPSGRSDKYVFYELNPTVIKWSWSDFSYLSDASDRGAQITVVEGDARLSLERQLVEGSQNFDVLILDAFSSDAIPIHLTTLEAFQLYFRHLAADGLLVIHISNKYVDLEPVLAKISDFLRAHSMVIENYENLSDIKNPTTVVLMSRSSDLLDFARTTSRDLHEKGRLWTDNQHSLLDVIQR